MGIIMKREMSLRKKDVEYLRCLLFRNNEGVTNGDTLQRVFSLNSVDLIIRNNFAKLLIFLF